MVKKFLQLRSTVNRVLGVLILCVLGLVANAQNVDETVILDDNFQQYTVGNQLAVDANTIGNNWWTTWLSNPGSSEDGVIAMLDDTKCAHLTYGNDQVLLLGDADNGIYELEFDIYVPEGKNGYFNVLHSFAGVDSKWAMQCYLNATHDGNNNTTPAAGHGTVHAGGNGVGDVPCVCDAWMHFRINVDTEMDWASLYYTAPGEDEILVCEWQWSLDSYGANVINRNISAMNFFPPLDSSSEFYLDNITFKRIGDSYNPNISDGELGYTTYDWQSNAGARTWTHVWPDGKVSFAYTTATTANYTDRGTAIDTYDPNTGLWTISGGRVETEKTGFGTIAQYGENGIVVAAHTSSKCGIYIIDNKDIIVANSTPAVSYLDPTYDPMWPNVMTSGENRSIIHVVANASTYYNGVENALFYFRSQDGGQTWDKENVILPFTGPEYCLDWGSNRCYWMETTEDNCLALVVNNAWSDGMVIYSYDDGETWERKVFYQHPDPFSAHEDVFYYPRWTSCQWDSEHNLHVLYEFNGTVGDVGSGTYYPGMGGVAYWNETMPYNENGTTVSAIEGNLTPGEPFVMDADYLNYDIYQSWWNFGENASHEMWPEYVGFLAPLDDDGQPEDPYDATEWNIDYYEHGHYNGGVCSFAVLCMDPDSDDMIAVWCAMDENRTYDNGIYYYSLFASRSQDGGQTWGVMVNLVTDFLYKYSEFAYPQAAIVDGKLVVACMVDDEPGTYVQSDESNCWDNHYEGFVFDIEETFPSGGYVHRYHIKTSVNDYFAGTATGGAKYIVGDTCTLTATPNYDFEFVNWTKNGEVVSTEPVYTFEVTAGGTYVANFQTVGGYGYQTYYLNSGWTWWATSNEMTGVDGLTKLENGLGDRGVLIASQANGFVQNYGENGWYGSLTNIENEGMYRVKTNDYATFVMVGDVADPANHPITVYNGWTYMGYMATEPMNVDVALADLEASDGDIIKSQNAFANYYEDYGWFGSLSTLYPGEGLMYKSMNEDEVTFYYPAVERGMGAVAETADDLHWTANMHDYPANMTVMAIVEIEGNVVYSPDYELAAFADGVCRGSVKLSYVEPIDHYVAFLTIGGIGYEQLTFGLYNETTGEEMFDTDATMVFVADEMVGSFDIPMIVGFRNNTGVSEVNATIGMYPNPVNAGGYVTIETAGNEKVYVEIVNTVGAVVTTETTNRMMVPETPGMYLMKVTVNGTTQILKLVVR